MKLLLLSLLPFAFATIHEDTISHSPRVTGTGLLLPKGETFERPESHSMSPEKKRLSMKKLPRFPELYGTINVGLTNDALFPVKHVAPKDLQKIATEYLHAKVSPDLTIDQLETKSDSIAISALINVDGFPVSNHHVYFFMNSKGEIHGYYRFKDTRGLKWSHGGVNAVEIASGFLPTYIYDKLEKVWLELEGGTLVPAYLVSFSDKTSSHVRVWVHAIDGSVLASKSS